MLDEHYEIMLAMAAVIGKRIRELPNEQNV
jgi:hypothetical protein